MLIKMMAAGNDFQGKHHHFEDPKVDHMGR